MPAVNVNDDMIKYLIKQGFLDAGGGTRLNVSAKKVDYTIVAGVDPSGTIFTNRGATAAVAFTLPAASLALAGTYYDFIGIADFAYSVKSAVVDTLTIMNDVAADSVAVSTAGQIIGGHLRAVCDGVAWIAFGASVGTTFTPAT